MKMKQLWVNIILGPDHSLAAQNDKVIFIQRTIEEDLLEETTFDSVDHLKDELLQYMYYYNHMRPHQALDGKTPVEFAQSCPRIM